MNRVARPAALMTEGARLEDTGQLAEAERMYRRVVTALRQQPLGRALGRGMTALGHVQQAQGRYRTAVRTLKRAVAICEATSGPRSVDTAAALNGLGVCYKYLARYDQAEAVYRRALAIASRGGRRSRLLATLHHNLGGLAHAAGRAADGEWHAREAVRLRRRLRGRNHLEVATDLAALAAVLDQQGKHSEAVRLYARAIAIVERTRGPEHVEIAASANNLAALLQASGRLAEAEAWYRRSLRIASAGYGKDHPQVMLISNNLGTLLAERGRLDEGTTLIRRAIRTLRRRLGPEHPHVVACQRNLAVLRRGDV